MCIALYWILPTLILPSNPASGLWRAADPEGEVRAREEYGAAWFRAVPPLRNEMQGFLVVPLENKRKTGAIKRHKAICMLNVGSEARNTPAICQ